MAKDYAVRELVATFVQEKETKNTIRFVEEEADHPPIIGTLYVQKYALRQLGSPTRIVVTIKS